MIDPVSLDPDPLAQFPLGAARPARAQPHWGGFRLAPKEWEFWLRREDRFHDRVRYRRDGVGWIRERLGP